MTFEANPLVTYVGPQDLHDGKIQRVTRSENNLTVIVQSPEGNPWTIQFFGVTEWKCVNPEGMTIYALAERTAPSSLRNFIFVNWDEEDSAMLEILAEDFTVTR